MKCLILTLVVTVLVIGDMPICSAEPRETRTNEYFVSPDGNDSSNGSAARPWRSIRHAANAVFPGDTVHVLPGTYAEAVTISQSGTATNRIVFISDTKWGALIRGSSVCQGFKTTGRYIDIIGFDISVGSFSCSQTQGIILSSHDRALGNRIHDLPCPCNSNGGSGIATNAVDYTTTDSEASGNVIDNIKGPTNCAEVHGQGIYLSTPNGKAFNNIISNTGRSCLDSWHAATNLVISGNTVMNCGRAGVSIGAGDAPGGVTNTGSIVTDNIVRNSATGLDENGLVSGTQFIKNLLYANTTDFSLVNGTATGTVSADPLHFNYTGSAITGDYHLRPGSPAIGAGTREGAPAEDFDGAVRPNHLRLDIGVYESSSTLVLWSHRIQERDFNVVHESTCKICRRARHVHQHQH